MVRNDLLLGAVAGLTATAAQTTVSRVVAPRLPPSMRPPVFVPDEVVHWVRCRMGIPGGGSFPARRWMALLAHLGYGSALGALYALTPLPRRLRPLSAGALWGAGAWALGFEGWIPALGILPRTTAGPPVQWVAPVLGHVLYGVATAVVYASMRHRSASSGSGSPSSAGSSAYASRRYFS